MQTCSAGQSESLYVRFAHHGNRMLLFSEQCHLMASEEQCVDGFVAYQWVCMWVYGGRFEGDITEGDYGSKV